MLAIAGIQAEGAIGGGTIFSAIEFDIDINAGAVTARQSALVMRHLINDFSTGLIHLTGGTACQRGKHEGPGQQRPNLHVFLLAVRHAPRRRRLSHSITSSGADGQ